MTVVANMKEGFHKVELHKTVWEVPEKYKNLAGIGSGAYGQVNYPVICYQYLKLSLKHSMHDNNLMK